MDDIFLDIGRFMSKKEKAAGSRNAHPLLNRGFYEALPGHPAPTTP
jgi:hypothetical protein